MSDIELLGLGGVAILALFLVIRAFMNRRDQAASEGSAETGGE
jgi:hypothetical protein